MDSIITGVIVDQPDNTEYEQSLQIVLGTVCGVVGLLGLIIVISLLYKLYKRRNTRHQRAPGNYYRPCQSFISLSLLPSLTHTLPLSPLTHSPYLTVSLSHLPSLSHLLLYSLTHSLSQLSHSLSVSFSFTLSFKFFYTLSLFGFTSKLRLMSYNEE